MKKFLKIITTMLLVIITFLGTIALLLLIPIRKTVNGNVAKEIISSMEIEKEVQENPALKEEVDELLAPVYEVTREVGLDDDLVLKLLDAKEVKDFMGDVTDNFINSLISGENQKIINPDDIENLISSAIDDVNKTGLYKIKDETKEKIINTFKEESKNIEEVIPNTDVVLDDLSDDLKQQLKIVSFILSDEFLIYVVSAILISLTLIILLNLRSMKWLKISSLTILIATIFVSLITLGIMIFNNLYLKFDYEYIFNVVNNFIKLNYMIDGIIIFVTIILLIIYHIIRKKNLKKELQ